MRLIDADAFIEDMKTRLWDWETVDGIRTSTALRQVMTDIANAPTVWQEKEEKRPRVLQLFEMKPGHLYWRETFEDGSMVLAEKPTAYDRAYRYWDEWPSKELREETLWDEDEDERRPEAWME